MEYQKLHEELNGTTEVRLYCTQSEDNLYEDIIGMFTEETDGSGLDKVILLSFRNSLVTARDLMTVLMSPW